MRKYLLFLLALVSCSKEYISFEPQFVLTGEVSDLVVGDKISISNNDKTYTYQVKSIGDKCELEAASDKDKIIITKDNNSFLYSIAYPSLEPEVPSVQNENTELAYALSGKIESKNPYKTFIVNMAKAPRCAILELELPYNLVASKTLNINKIELLGISYNFTKPLVLDSDKVVKVAVNPTTVASSGIDVKIFADNQEYNTTLLSGSSNISFCLGSRYRVYLAIIDDFKPCTFPVVFPLGKNPKARTGYYNYSDDQQDWITRGIWYCFDQKQVKAQWTKVSDPLKSYYQVREIVNGGEIGSIGVKGIWTGDYFEFAFPVYNLDKGTTINLQAPFYGRNQPIFWTVEWLEDGKWVNADKPITSWDGSTTINASFATQLREIGRAHV